MGYFYILIECESHLFCTPSGSVVLLLCLFSTGLSSSVDYNVMELEQELENVKIFKTKLGTFFPLTWFLIKVFPVVWNI